MSALPDVRPEDAEVLERHGFKAGVAYMPVSRCDGCRWWRKIAVNAGECEYVLRVAVMKRRLSIEVLIPEGTDGMQAGHARLTTAPDHGCTEWEARDAAPAL